MVNGLSGKTLRHPDSWDTGREFLERGFYPAFRFPEEVPTFGENPLFPDDGSIDLVTLPSVPIWWKKLIMGALVPLTMPESWDDPIGTFDGATFGVLGAHILLDMFARGVNERQERIIDWGLYFEGQDGSEILVNEMPRGVGPDDTRSYNVLVEPNYLGVASVLMQGKMPDEHGVFGGENPNAGGAFPTVLIEPVPFGAVTIWTISATELGLDTYTDSGTGANIWHDVEWMDAILTMEGEMLLTVTVQDPAMAISA